LQERPSSCPTSAIQSSRQSGRFFSSESTAILGPTIAAAGDQIIKQDRLHWQKVRWVKTIFDGKLGGIDVVSSMDAGTNGSIAPKKTLDVFEALQTAVSQYLGSKATPYFIDAGIAEGRAASYWAAFARYRQGPDLQAQNIDVFGIEQAHLAIYTEIHRVVEHFAEDFLGCPVKIRVLWQDSESISDPLSTFSVFDFLTTTATVVYSFWTAWLAPAKEALLALVGAEPKVLALAVFVKSSDTNSLGRPFNEDYILECLCQHSFNTNWIVFAKVQRCRFIGGRETATAVIFQRLVDSDQRAGCARNSDVIPELLTSKPHSFAFLDEDGYVDMCLNCGGGGRGYEHPNYSDRNSLFEIGGNALSSPFLAVKRWMMIANQTSCCAVITAPGAIAYPV
jgi:hypothetical protein